MTTYIQLGRLGDLINASKICFHEYKRTGKGVRLVVAREFAPLLESFPYIEPIIFNGSQDELPEAMRQFPGATVLQSWKNPDQSRQTLSYQMEAWRRAGKLDQWKTLPLTIQRSPKQEASYASLFYSPALTKPLILVATASPSSPFQWGYELQRAINEVFRDTHTIVEVGLVKANRPQDLLGLMDRAALLITVDTFPLHLAEASTCPVITILNDIGTSATQGQWASSFPPPQAAKASYYSQFANYGYRTIPVIVEWAKEILLPRFGTIIHAAQLHGTEDRHRRAQQTWVKKFDACAYTSAHTGLRSAKEIGDARNLPFLKDVLRQASFKVKSAGDIYFWCNDDNVLDPKLPDFLRKHVPIYGACSFRRTEPGTVGKHMGREAFAFTSKWLTDNWEKIPDYILGASSWDIGLAALIRHQRGIVTTKENLTHDFFPCDIGEGYVYHEAHPSAWSGANENSPSNQFNRRLLKIWQGAHQPQIKEVLA